VELVNSKKRINEVDGEDLASDVLHHRSQGGGLSGPHFAGHDDQPLIVRDAVAKVRGDLEEAFRLENILWIRREAEGNLGESVKLLIHSASSPFRFRSDSQKIERAGGPRLARRSA